MPIVTGFPDSTSAGRKDALTKKPLDLEEEDEARKFETSKWLESHFGSDSRSSHGSLDADDSPLPTSTNTSYINVTMKSCAPKEREYQNVSSSRRQKRATGRDSESPSGYFHGISEWSERQGRGARNYNFVTFITRSFIRYFDWNLMRFATKECALSVKEYANCVSDGQISFNWKEKETFAKVDK